MKVSLASFVKVSALVLATSPLYSYADEDVTVTDAKIVSAVKAALNSHAALRANGLRVQSVNEVVYIYGQVDTRAEAADAVEIVRNVPQVEEVVDMTSTGFNG